MQNIEVVILILVLLRIAWTVSGNVIATHTFRHVLRTCQQQVVIFFVTGTSNLYKRSVLLAIVSADGKACFKPLAYFNIHTGTIVPTIVVKSSKVTILFKIGYAGKIPCILCGTTHIDTVFHCCTCFPIFIQKVVVKTLHGFKFICLEQFERFVQGCICRVGSYNCVVKTSIVVCAKHFWTCHFVCKTECATVRYSWSTKLTFLCCNKDYTVCGTCTINSSRSVFQYRDAFYLAWVKIVECLSTKVL